MSAIALHAAPALAFAVAFGLLAAMLKGRLGTALMDRPNERSLHSAAVPRSGGIALFAGVVAGWLLLPRALPGVLWACLLILLVVSVTDDWRAVRVLWRLLAHVGSAALLVLSLFGDGISIAVAGALVITIAWMTNLYNFMDGSDGLAGGMAAVGFGCYGAAALLAGDVSFAMVNFCVAAAALAFLAFNFHPARIFMGDAGSIPLGFLAAAFGLMGWRDGNWPAWFPLAVFSPFAVDASVTLAKRALRGQRIWEAHRGHYYQRMVLAGWGHRNTALAAYGLMLVCGAAALGGIGCSAPVQTGIVTGLAVMYGVLIVAFERRSTSR